MELYYFVRGLFAWTVTIAVLWPINVPMLALAFRIQHGTKRLPLSPEQLWWRSTFAALFVALVTVVYVLLDYVLSDWAEIPAGPVHLVIFAAYVPVAAWILFVMFAHSEYSEGFGLFVLYIYLPVFVLYLLNALTGLWDRFFLDSAYGWLKVPA